jgi:hypothetical protein
MRYKCQFFKAGTPFTDLNLHGEAPASLAHAISRVIAEFNDHLTQTKEPSSSAMQALISLMSDMNKSKHILEVLAHHPVPKLNQNPMTTLFNYLTKLATQVGLELVISENVLSLTAYAAKVVEQHRFLYADQLPHTPAAILAKYPNIHINAQAYIKTRMCSFRDSYLSQHLETKVVLCLHALSRNEPQALYTQIHKLLTTIDYKNTLTAVFKKTLISPILECMRNFHGKKIPAEQFADSVRSIIAGYKPEDAGELKFLMKFDEILLNSQTPAKDLHALLRNKEYPLTQTFVPLLKNPLIQIIKEYNAFVIQLKADEDAHRAESGKTGMTVTH